MRAFSLCLTCAERKECVHRKGRKHVFQCDEFVGERPDDLKPRKRRRLQHAEKSST